VRLRLTPARFALSYIALGVVALALLAVPLWYGFQANLGTFRSYIPAAEMQRFVDIFHRDGPQAVAAAVDAYATTLPPDQVAIFVGPQKQRLAGNLPNWPAQVPDVPGTYGLVIERGGNARTRVVVSNVDLPDGYVLLMGRESVIFDSLVARFWFGIAGAIAILLSLGLLFGWLLRRAHGQLEGLVARRTVALQLSEERYSIAIEASEEGFVDVNVDTGEFVTSERLNEIFGIAPGTRFSGRGDFLKQVRFYGKDGETYVQTIRASEADDGPDRYQFEFRIILSTGERRWIWTRGKVRRDAEGRARRRVGVFSDITARKCAEEALRLSEERYERAMEGSDAGHWDWNIVSDEIFVSERAREMLALPPGALPMRRSEIMELVPMHPDDRAAMAEKVNASIRSGIHERDYRVITVPGQVRWLRSRGKVYRDAHGAAVRMTGSLTDITDRKLASDALRASEERYSLAMDASEEAHFDVDVDTDELFTSERLNEIYGFPSGTRCLKRSEYLKDFRFYGNDAESYDVGIRAAEAKGGPERYDFEYRILRSSGEVRWLRTRGKVTRDAEGGARRRTGMVADITEAKLAAEALRASEERYSLAMEASEEGHFDWNVRTDDIFVSAHIKKVFGFPLDAEFRTRNDLIARISYHPDDAPWLITMARDTLTSSALTHEFDYRIVRGGEIHWLQARWKIFRDAAGAAQRVIGVVTDVTERKRAEEELKALEDKLRQAQRLEAMGTLAGGIAHDFNNILGAILGFGEMAMRDVPKGSRLWRDLDCIIDAGERGRALVDRVLAFSRSSVGERVPVHVERVVREALDQLSAKLPPAITLKMKLHAARAAMQGDPTQVHQVVMNLATNAIQAMTGGGTLCVSLHVERIEQARAPTIGTLAPAEYLVLQVADTGTGIPADVLERMFDPFFTTKEVGTGTGLGLSIVHGIVIDVGGAVDVASTVGAGSTFTIYLPRAGDAVETDPDEKPSLPRGDGQRVLVVDDEEPLVRLATRTLEELGYAPVGFTSSRAALAAFRADPQRFDAVITDERMPGMSGSALIRRVRGIRDRIPVVLMSGYVGDAVARQAREAGAEEVLRKPLSARDLATSLARVLYS
jgi:PAS domain S-box-containing protein